MVQNKSLGCLLFMVYLPFAVSVIVAPIVSQLYDCNVIPDLESDDEKCHSIQAWFLLSIFSMLILGAMPICMMCCRYKPYEQPIR